MRRAATWARLVTILLGVCSATYASAYRIQLEPFIVPPGGAVGLVARVRINGGRTLRLLVDSGAQFVVLTRSAARKSGCVGGAELELVGAGAASATPVKHLRADALQIGDLTLRGVPLLIVERELADGIQGALPLSVFAGFLIRLDVAGNALRLLPYPTGPEDETTAIPILSNNQLLFVKGTVNETHQGYFLLDTGSSYSAISRNLARELHFSELLAHHVALQGGTAAMDAPLLSGSVRLRFGSQIAAGPIVAVDLSTASRYHEIEISGLIGYAALRDFMLTVNYRDGLIRLDPK
jgi:predicted aspartyl protease